MNPEDVCRLPLREKLQIMEAIWRDLRDHVDGCDPPREHRDLLDARRTDVDSGEAKLLDWDSVKHSIGTR
jgi:putative addiction module component (TIGR02574 family)